MATDLPPRKLNTRAEEIEAQSGRFEFLKQCLTLGLAGLAGTAALFTDASKLPTLTLTIITLGVFGVALVAITGGSLFGISGYANLLDHFDDENARNRFRRSPKKWAFAAFCGVLVAPLAMLAFAVEQVWSVKDGQPISAVSANDAAWKAVAMPGCPLALEQSAPKGSGYEVVYRSTACGRLYTVTVDAKDPGRPTIRSAPLPNLSKPAPGIAHQHGASPHQHHLHHRHFRHRHPRQRHAG
jgi:hypothetical protein